MSIRWTLAGTLLLTAALAACDYDLFGPGDDDLRIIPDSLVLLLGDTTHFRVQYEGADGTLDPNSVEWVSYGDAIARMIGPGRARGVETGTTAILASRESAQGLARVTVMELTLDSVTAGRLHSCAWADGGTAYCWGYNSYGQLGSEAGGGNCGGAPCHFRPVPVSGDLSFAALAAGGEHTCGLTPDGRAYCWGRGVEGQLGTGNTGEGFNSDPTAVSGGHMFTSLATGGHHSCALTPEGRAYCWGENSAGQLGTGNRNSSPVPVAVVGGLRFEALAAGLHHTCGLSSSGVVHCWGENDERQLGNGSRSAATTPVRVAGEQTFVAITAGDLHNCGLTEQSAAYCWGGNSDGQVGDGSRSSAGEPTPVRGGHSFTAIAAGGAHTCAATAGGGAACWGWNGYRQIGDNAGLRRRTTPTPAHTDLRFAMLDAGRVHTCAATAEGKIRCWGYNGAGQMGRTDRVAGCPAEERQFCTTIPEPIVGSR